MKKTQRFSILALAAAVLLAVTGCYETSTEVDIALGENDELVVTIDHTHWVDLDTFSDDQADASAFLEEFNADEKLIPVQSLMAPGKIGRTYEATITEDDLAAGPVSVEVGYGALVITSETVFGSRKLEVALDVDFEFDIDPMSDIQISGPEFWMTGYESTNSNVWMQPTDDELELGWSSYGVSMADGAQPWSVRVVYEEPIEPEAEPEPSPSESATEEAVAEESSEPQEQAPAEATAETAEPATTDAGTVGESEQALGQGDSEPATPINFAIWMVLIMILAAVVGMFVFLVRSRAKS